MYNNSQLPKKSHKNEVLHFLYLILTPALMRGMTLPLNHSLTSLTPIIKNKNKNLMLIE